MRWAVPGDKINPKLPIRSSNIIANPNAVAVPVAELSNDFVGVMSDHLRAGDQTIQALHLVAVSEDRPLIRIRELAFHLGNHLRPLAHTILGGSSGLHGTGMCFAADIARRYRWSESSVVDTLSTALSKAPPASVELAQPWPGEPLLPHGHVAPNPSPAQKLVTGPPRRVS